MSTNDLAVPHPAACSALQVQPDFLPALLGAAETRLAAAYTYGRMGAVGTAAAELAAATEHALQATRTRSNCVVRAGHRLLWNLAHKQMQTYCAAYCITVESM